MIGCTPAQLLPVSLIQHCIVEGYAMTYETSKDQDFRDFDVHRKDVRVGAECLWARMREHPQLPKSEQLGGFRVISRYQDLKKALLSETVYSSASGITIPEAHVRTRHI